MDNSVKLDHLVAGNMDSSQKNQKDCMQPTSEEESDGIKDINKVEGRVPSEPPNSIFFSKNKINSNSEKEEGEIISESEHSISISDSQCSQQDENEIIKSFDFDIDSLDINFTPRDLVRIFVHLSLYKYYDHGINNVTKTELSMKGIKFWDNLSTNPKFSFLFARYKPWSLHTSYKRLFSRASVGQIIKLLNEDADADINSLTNLFKKSKKRKTKKISNENKDVNFLNRKKNFVKMGYIENINKKRKEDRGDTGYINSNFSSFVNSSNFDDNELVVDLSSCKINRRQSYNQENINLNLRNNLSKRISRKRTRSRRNLNIYEKRSDIKVSDLYYKYKDNYLPFEKINFDINKNKDYTKNKFENFFNLKSERKFLNFSENNLLRNLHLYNRTIKDDLSDLYDEFNNNIDNKIKRKLYTVIFIYIKNFKLLITASWKKHHI